MILVLLERIFVFRVKLFASWSPDALYQIYTQKRKKQKQKQPIQKNKKQKTKQKKKKHVSIKHSNFSGRWHLYLKLSDHSK